MGGICSCICSSSRLLIKVYSHFPTSYCRNTFLYSKEIAWTLSDFSVVNLFFFLSVVSPVFWTFAYGRDCSGDYPAVYLLPLIFHSRLPGKNKIWNGFPNALSFYSNFTMCCMMEMDMFFVSIYLLERGNHVQSKKPPNIQYSIQRKNICSINTQQLLRHRFFSTEVTMLLIQRKKIKLEWWFVSICNVCWSWYVMRTFSSFKYHWPERGGLFSVAPQLCLFSQNKILIPEDHFWKSLAPQS